MQMEPMELQHAVFETDGGRIDAMWSDVRLHAGDIPDGWHCYAVRGGDGGWPPCSIEKTVWVNHAGDIITPDDLDPLLERNDWMLVIRDWWFTDEPFKRAESSTCPDTSTAACSNRSRTRRRSTACDSRSACPHGPETSTSPRNASAPTCKSSRNPRTPAPTVTKTAGLFHARMHDGHDAPPTTHRPRDFFAGPFHFPRSKCPNPPPFPRRTIGVRHRPSPQGHGRKERGVNAIILHGIAQSCRVKSLPIHEMDMGVASDVIVATITRNALRFGLPGRPVPHGRRSLQTAHAASQTAHLRAFVGGAE